MASVPNALTNEELGQILSILKIEDAPGNRDQVAVLAIAMNTFIERNTKYKDLWKKYGSLGNVLHISSKASRLEELFWRQGGYDDEGNRYDADDAIDLINYTVFFLRNLKDGNERG